MHVVGTKSMCVEFNSADTLCFEGTLQRRTRWDRSKLNNFLSIYYMVSLSYRLLIEVFLLMPSYWWPHNNIHYSSLHFQSTRLTLFKQLQTSSLKNLNTSELQSSHEVSHVLKQKHFGYKQWISKKDISDWVEYPK